MCAIAGETQDCINSLVRRLGSFSELIREKTRAPQSKLWHRHRIQEFVGRAMKVPDKDLTPLSSTCANIGNQLVDHMARLHQRGSQISGIEIRTVALSSRRLSLPKFLTGVFALTLTFFCLAGVRAIAQDSDVDDVHISPHPATNNTNVSNTTVKDALNATVTSHTTSIKSQVDLVLVPVTVTDPLNRLVTGLDKDNFEVYEGKEKEEVRHFSSEDAPISLGVIFDMSGSMASKIERAREAVIEFFKTANPQDEFFLITFADRPEEISDFTQSI